MQDDLISRQAAINELNDSAELLRRVLDDTDIVGVERAKYEWGLDLIESYISDVEELPSADAVPVVHGKWEERYIEDAPIFFRNKVYCSICESWATYGKTKYCPHCGALMDEVTE